MNVVEFHEDFIAEIFVTGMHTLSLYGLTEEEVRKEGFSNIHCFINQILGEPMDLIMSNTITGLSRFVHEHRPNMIVVHGDRVEALAGAIVGSIRNILVAHIEGGERSGTIDELLRHAISKLSHIHFVANKEAFLRLKQMGEDSNSIFIIGSPEIEAMFSSNLPDLKEVKRHYDISFDNYAILLFHSVTTELDSLEENSENLVDAIVESPINFIGIYPNNDEGSNLILQQFRKLENVANVKLFPSIRFEYFLTLLKNSMFIIGNSSSGIREAPIYGVLSINVGSRQNKRYNYESIINIGHDKKEIFAAMEKIQNLKNIKPSKYFGDGQSSEYFKKAIESDSLWKISTQKSFIDL